MFTCLDILEVLVEISEGNNFVIIREIFEPVM